MREKNLTTFSQAVELNDPKVAMKGLSFWERLDYMAQNYPNKLVLVVDDATYTYEMLNKGIREVARELANTAQIDISQADRGQANSRSLIPGRRIPRKLTIVLSISALIRYGSNSYSGWER